MKGMIVALLLGALCSGLPAAAQPSQAENARLQGLVLFVLDVEMYRGGFFAVYDYCSPHVPALIARQTMDAWMGDNQRYLNAQRQAEQQFLAAMAARGTAARARERLAAAKHKFFARMRVNNRLITQIEPLPDKETACVKRMGQMVSHSLSLERVSPETYQYWLAHFGPRSP